MTVFNTYDEAYTYWLNHKDIMGEGRILTISQDGHTVQARQITDTEPTKRDRSGEVNGRFGTISDDLGTQGILNHADGKLYDSKSAFRKATRRAGCYEMGNDVKPDYQHKREIRGDFNVRPQLKEAVQKVVG